jgi:putative sigma-54 modulation protein
MEITITAKGIEKLPEYTEEEIKKKIGKLEKYFDNIQQANVVINKVRGVFELEVTIFASQKIIRGVGKGSLIDEALDNVVEKLETQVKKLRDRLKGEKRISKEELFGSIEEEESEFPKITKVKTFPVKPMSIEEAVLQIELLGHDFFIFRDEETNEINVLYRRKDGNYGLIKPQ